MKDNIESQAEMLENRLRKRQKHLAKWARRGEIGAYRLYDRDIPEIPLVIDHYRGRAGPEGPLTALAGARYRRPGEGDPAGEAAWLTRMEEAIAAAMGVPRERIFMKERRRLRRRQEQYGKIDSPGGNSEFEGGAELIVNEGRLKFQVNLSDYLDTGLFLDRRKIRALVGEEAGGKRVLNLFAYTCAFSVAAAAGGAATVDSVDLSNTYLDWGRRNFSLNGLAGAAGGFRFIRADALRFLENAGREGRKWDLIILDPPAFSNSKKMTGTLDIRRDHPRLISRCLGLLSPGGRLWFSAGTSRFRLDREGIGNLAGPRNFNIEEPGDRIVDEDFRGKRNSPCFIFSL
jgi:23S rRNA G2069 N7-methylase RlmK/C1962 C5-methylase RlmI